MTQINRLFWHKYQIYCIATYMHGFHLLKNSSSQKMWNKGSRSYFSFTNKSPFPDTRTSLNILINMLRISTMTIRINKSLATPSGYWLTMQVGKHLGILDLPPVGSQYKNSGTFVLAHTVPCMVPGTQVFIVVSGSLWMWPSLTVHPEWQGNKSRRTIQIDLLKDTDQGELTPPSPIP